MKKIVFNIVEVCNNGQVLRPISQVEAPLTIKYINHVKDLLDYELKALKLKEKIKEDGGGK